MLAVDRAGPSGWLWRGAVAGPGRGGASGGVEAFSRDDREGNFRVPPVRRAGLRESGTPVPGHAGGECARHAAEGKGPSRGKTRIGAAEAGAGAADQGDAERRPDV